MGDDAACIFFEIWYTSQDQQIRHKAKQIAKEMLIVYERKMLSRLKASPEDDWNTGDFFSVLYMLRCKHEMGLSCERLIEAADMIWEAKGLRNTAELFGVTKDELSGIETDPCE